MGFYRADWRRKKKKEEEVEEGEEKRETEGEDQGAGECEEIDMEKEEKITNVIWPAAAVIISHSS